MDCPYYGHEHPVKYPKRKKKKEGKKSISRLFAKKKKTPP